MKQRRLLILSAALMLSASLFAQQRSYSGRVLDSNGDPVIGATVRVPGSATGVITDLDGRYTISVDPGTKLEVTYVGMATQTITAGNNMNVTLKEDDQTLKDVVVIGYGVQKKSVVTASIAKVSADDLEGKTRLRADDALKGMAAGVNVTSSSGQPGSKSFIRIRGNGTINNSDPLYIIDGMPTDQNGMELINPEDIESMEVLKDAASGAIYGARAANGVILVTTKRGKTGKASINYNFSYGWQSPWRKRDITSATDYAILQNEKYVNAVNGNQEIPFADPYNLTYDDGTPLTGFGTNWQNELFNDDAPIVQHNLSVSGGTDNLDYFLSMGYFTQDGIVGGNYGQSNYNRLTLRSNTNYTFFDASKERNFLNKLTAGVNIGYMRVKNTGVDANSTWGSPLGSALYLSPMLPVTVSGDAAEEMATRYANYDIFRDGNGNPYTIPGYFGSYQEQNNPIAMMQTYPQQNWAHKFMPKFSLDLQLWDNLVYHFTWSAEQSFWGYDAAVKQTYYLSGNNNQDHTSATSYKGNSTRWQVENTLSYDKTIGKHTFNIVLGQSAMKFKGDELGGGRWNLVNPDKPSINYATGTTVTNTDSNGNITGATSQFNVWGAPYAEHTMSSLFGRLSYNYDERYMAQVTIRRDGSSRFGSNNKYGTFPSFSLGWNIMNEKFMEPARNWLSNAKLRLSWGKNGNDEIGDFTFAAFTAMGYNYYFGRNQQISQGSKALMLPNPDLKWEESEQTDIGLDLGFFNGALTFTVDWFKKKTNGMILSMPIPSYVGETAPLANVGDMTNSGWEFELGYKGHVADFQYSIKGNASYLHNELNNLGNESGFINYGISQFSDGGTRAENGQPFPYFYGYKTAGVIQNQEDLQNYIQANCGGSAANSYQGAGLRPGDMKFVDTSDDGKVDMEDRTKIGNPTPAWSFGFTASAAWKGFDFSMFWQGVSGNDVFDATYRHDIASGNYPTWMLNRWTGEGTSNTVPRLALGDDKNWVVSDLYVHDGSYLRLKNIQLGYTLPKSLTRKAFIERLRFFVMAENLITWTHYWGFDPEIGTGNTSMGVDYGVYPQARTWTVGFNITL